MDKQAFDKRYEEYRRFVEFQLTELLHDAMANHMEVKDLYEAMGYSLLAGGKRLRPVLVLAFAHIAGGGGWQHAGIPACAVEMVHTYSLIHDDLPCMDDDDLRRGKPTNHKIFGETMAVLAGDALQTLAFSSLHHARIPAMDAGDCAFELARAAGPGGMVGGQVLDTLHEPKSEAELLQVHRLKTGALIRAACRIGCICGGVASPFTRDAAEAYGENLGLAFQIRDDMLDVMGDEASFGKPIGSDRAKGKVTFVDLYGLEGCEAQVRKYTERAKSALLSVDWPAGTDFLLTLADVLADRRK